MRSRLSCAAVMAASLMIFAGCGGLNSRYPVSGKVLYNGEPAVGATVIFVSKDAPSQTHQGVVGEDGTFTLAGPAGDGALPGEYTVLVEWKEGAGRSRGRSPGLSAPDRLKKRYLDPKKPLLTATVDAKTNNLPTFELK